jgi:pantoate--beta-alanine ligase
MNVVRTRAEVRRAVAAARRTGREIAFVPTMGALHEGHLSLVRAARATGASVVVSIFVNPLQFGPGEDLDAYPRDEDRDVDLLRAEGADVVFLPPVEEMYPPGRATVVRVAGVSDPLEGAQRPGHFDGVATVCAKLFNIVTPDRVFFGQKDAQQVAVLRRMILDLDFSLELVVCPTVREPSGLARSSRNVYLSESERESAAALFRSLRAGEPFARRGEFGEAERAMREVLDAAPAVATDYARVVDPDTFGAPRPDAPVLLAVAARVGPARLIDNLLVEPTRT